MSGRIVADDVLGNVAEPARTEVPRQAPRPFAGELSPYAEKALDGEVEAAASHPPGSGRHTRLFAAAAALGELVAGGELPRGLVEDRLRDACEANGMIGEGRASEVERAIRDGIEAGLVNPRHGDPARKATPRPAAAEPEEPAYLREELDGDAEPELEPEADAPAAVLESNDLPARGFYSGPTLPASCWRPGFVEYRDAYARTTEATDAFAWGGYLCAAGLMLGRNARLRCGVRVFANSYGVNCGESGLSRKSTSRDNAAETARAADESILTVPAIGSPEGLLEMMADGEGAAGPARSRRVLLDVDELSALLVKANAETTRGLGPMLTRLYDCPDEYALPKAGQKRRVAEPFVSILTSTTLEWLQRDMTEALLRGGLANRFLYYVGAEKPPIAFPLPAEDRSLAEARRLLVAARDRHGVFREYAVTPEAEKVFERWYLDSRSRAEESPVLSVLSHRLHSNAWRVALVFAALEDTGTVTPEQMTAAVEFAEYQRAAHRFVFEGYGETEGAKLARRILTALAKHGAMPTWRLRQVVRHADPERFQACLKTLANLAEIRARVAGKGRAWELVKHEKGR